MKFAWYIFTASSIESGAKCEAKTKGKPFCAASSALKVLEPSNQIGIFNPYPGIALTALFPASFDK